MKCPCIDCDNKGCGSFHDKCEEFQKYKESIKVIHDNKKKHCDKFAPIGKYKGRQK